MSTGKHLTTEIISQILALQDAGHEMKEISKLLSMDPTTVRHWVRWRREENSGTTPVPRKSSGRLRKISTRASAVIKCIMESTPCIYARKMKEENLDIFGEVSVRTVSRQVFELNYKSQKPIRKSLLTSAQRKQRVKFTKMYLNFTQDDWLDVLWSDESIFTMTCNRGGRVYRCQGSNPLDPQYVK